MNYKAVLSKMNLQDKIALCSGADFWHTKQMDQYNIPDIMLADGPNGLRKQETGTDMLGINASVPATSFPAAVSVGNSWDEEIAQKVGEAIAQEAAANGVALVLGPGANIKRSPLCGRNFEYYSEDPYLTGKIAAAFIKGAESTGAGCSVKHFAFNNQEYKRFSSDSVMDERTMRELYLVGFEMAVKEGKPSAVMSAYNKINGIHCSESKMLLTDILRGEWGFGGTVLTDWGGMSDRIKSFQAGCDLCMPGGSGYMEKEAFQAVADGTLNEAVIDKSAERVLRMIFRGAQAMQANIAADMNAHHALACKVAEESAVLMKNDDCLLPLTSKEDVVFIGHMAKEIRFQGAGSSHINPWKLVNVTDCDGDIPFVPGCDARGDTTDALIAEAVQAAGKAGTAVVFAGLTPSYESEGYDRDNLKMPAGHIKMIEAVADANPNTVVVLMCGSVVELPWEKKVKSILYMGLPGQAGGKAISNLLFGKAVPCGKLAESWPIKYEDCVCSAYYAGKKKDAHYREGLYVGYRYYAAAAMQVRYPFGHGLSYTTFSYSDLKIENNSVNVTVTNSGSVPAKEVVQLYITPPKSALYRPVKELKAFQKIHLNPGESKIVAMPLSDRSFAVWNNGWVIQGGTYKVSVGGSSEFLPLTGEIRKQGDNIHATLKSPAWYVFPQGTPSHEDWEQLMGRTVQYVPLKKGEFTMDNTIMEMKDYSLIMRIMYKAVEAAVAKGFGGKKDYESPEFRMLMNSSADSTLSGMKISGAMRNYILEGMLSISNGHFFKGIRMLMKKY